MRADGVVVLAPLLNENLGFFQGIEEFAIEQFITHFAIEAFDIAVLPGAARFNEQGLDRQSAQPGSNAPGGKL